MSKDLLNLSDEELMNLNPSALEGFTFGGEVVEEESVDAEESVVEESEASTSSQETQVDDAEVAATEEEEGESQVAPDDQADEGAEVVAPAEAKTDLKAEEPAEKKVDAVPTEGEGIDYKAEYERLMAPFKANGRDIQVKSVEDAVSLMQMGANYNKKMAALKPNLKLLKMLENSGLLSEEKLSYLIDLDKKNPAAISKLVKDSGLDPLDIDTEKAGGYKPNTYTVDDRELALDSVLEEIQDTPSYNRTLDVVTNKWDAPSKRVVAENPQLLKVINSHIDMGIYDLISKEVESERLFGRLSGISDLEAYRQVGDAIQARGGFAHLGRQEQKTPNAPVVMAPKPKKAEDPKVREQRRAASTTKPAAPAVTPAEFNPLSMSDEEFSKAATPKFN